MSFKGVVGIGTISPRERDCTLRSWSGHFLGGRYWFLNAISFQSSSFSLYRTPISVCLRFERVYKRASSRSDWSPVILARCTRDQGETTRYLSPWKRANFVSRARTASDNWSRHNFSSWKRKSSPTGGPCVYFCHAVYHARELIFPRGYTKKDVFSHSLLSLSLLFVIKFTSANYQALTSSLTSCAGMTCHARRELFAPKLQYFLSFKYSWI